MLNHIVIMGRLTRDPELRYTQSQVPVASFTVAVERDYSDQSGDRQTDFIDCTAWRQTGEFVSKYFRKGSMIVVSGRLQSRKWQDRDGNKRTNWEVNADVVYFGESRRDSEDRSYQQASANPGSTGNAYAPPPSSYSNSSATPSGLRDLGPGSGDGNPFTKGQQQALDDDGELPF